VDLFKEIESSRLKMYVFARSVSKDVEATRFFPLAKLV
jgi:hypothetical protein